MLGTNIQTLTTVYDKLCMIDIQYYICHKTELALLVWIDN